jgi:hypothetical protein
MLPTGWSAQSKLDHESQLCRDIRQVLTELKIPLRAESSLSIRSFWSISSTIDSFDRSPKPVFAVVGPDGTVGAWMLLLSIGRPIIQKKSIFVVEPSLGKE